MKILIIQHKWIGDVLLTSLLCENIKKKYPNSTIDYLVNSNTIPLLENNPYIDQVIVFENYDNKNLFKIIKFSKTINKNKYDIVIDAYSKIPSLINVFINDAPKKISYKRFGKKLLYTDNIVKHKKPLTNLGLAIEHRLALLSAIGIEKPTEVKPKLYLKEEEILWAKNLFSKHKIDTSRKTVMINLLGSSILKTYPLDKMFELIRFLGDNYNVNILFNYLPTQKKEAEMIYNNLSDYIKDKIYFDLYGTDLRSFIAIINECDFIIGNEGGATNIAKALDKKSFVIFSPYVSKIICSSFEDGINHINVHVEDYFPEKIKHISKKQMKKHVKNFYSLFDFTLFKNKLTYFLDSNL